MEQRCREDDEQKAYRKDLEVIVRHLDILRYIARLCAGGRRTKDSPMIVLMPAMLASLLRGLRRTDIGGMRSRAMSSS